MNALFEACPWSRCISLRESSDRRKDTREEFARRGQTVTFHVVQRDNDNPGRGCYSSHYNCMVKALKANQPRALVVEDDVEFAKAPRAAWEDAARFLETESFDILLLGWCTGDYRANMCTRTPKTRVPGFAHVYATKGLCTHAVVYSKKFMERFVKNHEKYPGYEIDDVFVDMDLEMYIVAPLLFDQRPVESTIDDATVERVYLKPTA